MNADFSHTCEGCEHVVKVRRPDMERCELYKPGDFNTRYRTEVNE